MTDPLSQKILERIAEKGVTPIPRWVIVVRRLLVAFVLAASLVVAAALGSLLLFAAARVDPAFLRVSGFGPTIHLILSYVPVIWVLLFAGVCVLELVLVQRETRAYRYSALRVGALLALGVCLLGFGFYVSNIPERIEASFQRHLPPPVRPFMLRGQPHPRPEDGVLFGRILDISSDAFVLEGPARDRWYVTPEQPELLTRSFLVRDRFVLVQGIMIRPGEFRARTIEPHRGPPPPLRYDAREGANKGGR